MPGIASATGLIEACIRPVHRPKLKHVELSGFTKPAPFVLRPFSGLFNPYPYGCSVLCNHPADCEAKEILRRAKDLWAIEGKALLLPEEMDMIRASLVAGAVNVAGNVGAMETINTDTAIVPEELFQKYTETDSRPLTPAPTLASGHALTNRLTQDEFPITSNPRECTTLVLDLRANSKKQMSSSRDREEDVTEKTSKGPIITHKRGRRLCKRKCKRSPGYRHQTEVRDLLEPTETQVSHIGESSRRTSIHTCNDYVEKPPSPKKVFALTNVPSVIPPSFIDQDILEHLSRELDWDKVEAEFSIRVRP